jgi:glycosyltransferase involved in cell wall biosynthesis
LPYEKWVPLLCTADIGIEPAPANPLNNISTMNKLMDYMALGKPCVAYDLREHRVTAGDSALYASPNDEKDLARQILRLIENPALCQQLGQVGQERIRSSLAWSFQRERLLNLYASIYPSHPAQ